MSKIKKSLFMLSIVLISLLCVGAVCAADVDDDTISSIDEVQAIDSTDEIDEVIQEPAIVEEPQAAEEEPPIAEDDTTKTFTQLIDDIGTESSEVTLTGTYKFDPNVDTAYPVISRDLTINGPATIDGNGIARLFAVTSGTLTLKNLNLINGNANQQMKNAGGVLAQSTGSLDIQGCTFKNNAADQVGGAILINSPNGYLKIKDTVFESNKAGNGTAGQGGAIEVGKGKSEIRNCTFIDCNASVFGGAVDIAFTDGIITNCTFINDNSKYGGAVSLRGADAVISDSVFKENTAAQGGSALYVLNVSSTISNCIFDSNFVPSDSQYGYQGTVYLFSNENPDMNVAISKCIFTNNSALRGSAITSWYSGFTVENSIFVNNIATDEAFNLGPEARDIFVMDDLENPKTVVVDKNWFGSTASNYTKELVTFNETHNMYQGVANVNITNWYFLKLTKTAATASYYTLLISLNNLYDVATGEVSKVDDCALPNVKAGVSATVGKYSPVTATLKNGVANVKYVLSASQKTGTVTATVSGVSQKLKITKTNTAIKVSPLKKYTYNKAVDAKKNYYIYATLKDSKGNVLKNKKIKIVSKGKTYTRTTDSKGRVKLLVTYVGKGTYKQKFTFAGDNMYNGATITAKLKVIAQKVKLTAPKKTYKASKKVKKLTATLKNSKGKALKGKKITFTVNKKKYTAKTNKKGVATVKVKLSKKKTYTVTVKFAGDKTYKKLTKKTKVVIK